MYALQRGGLWITAPEGQGLGQILPPVLAISGSAEDAWVAPDIDLAHERQALLRSCWGWNTEIRAIRP